MIRDFLYWYKLSAPKYGYIRSLEYSLFNALYFKRDCSYKTKTNGEPQED